jgi:ribosomal protein S18 acetylase RimI-like enzyme
MTAGAGRPATSSLVNPREDHPEAITLGLHDASPQHMVDAMADDVVLELGWGRLIFGQTFADPDKLAEVLRQEGQGRRDICMYAREPQVLVALAPAELFIDPSHTYRLRFSDDDSDASPAGFTVRTLESADDADEINRVYVRCGMVPAPVDVLWDNNENNDAVDYLVAVRDDDGSLLGTVTGVDHELLFADPENGSSLWTLAVDPTSSLPGVGATLTRALAALYRERGRAYMDLSVTHDNAAAIALYEKLGFERVPVMAVKRKERDQRAAVHPSAGNRRGPEPLRADHRRRSDATRDLGRGARCRGGRDASVTRRSQRHHPRSRCRSSHPLWRWPAATTSA